MSEQQQRELARHVFANALEVCADFDIPDPVIIDELAKITLGLIGATAGGPEALPDRLRAIADGLEDLPPPTVGHA